MGEADFSDLRARVRQRGVAIAVSGIDGSGKTTVCEQLLRALVQSGQDAKRLHIYRWYANVAYTPFVLLHNRWIGRRVLLFDRTIFDNLAVAVAEGRLKETWFAAILGILRVVYPAFDYRFFLTAPLEEISRRRPDTVPARYSAMLELYRRIMAAVKFTELRSDETLLASILSRL